MISDEALEIKLKNKLDKLSISDKAKKSLVSELNYISNFLIDIFKEKDV